MEDLVKMMGEEIKAEEESHMVEMCEWKEIYPEKEIEEIIKDHIQWWELNNIYPQNEIEEIINQWEREMDEILIKNEIEEIINQWELEVDDISDYSCEYVVE